MIEFDYSIDYKTLDFTEKTNRHLYRIGRGEQGVLLVQPYSAQICLHWRFKTPQEAQVSAATIFARFWEYMNEGDFIGMDMCRKFLEMGFTRSRRYANHHSGCKYGKNREILPQEADHSTCHYAESAKIFKEYRDKAAKDPTYVKARRWWREAEDQWAKCLPAPGVPPWKR
ncbi:hypothetical protein S-PM2d053 [Synechococcus phage S-PM2]|uniref:Hypothetical-Protein / belonging to T4-LIKE GC: 331 n=1 Tax=Synechococcus phage S-PM2 TaxID=238854 RepID=Q5GQY3_BPSYP|nr:Hypothetical-Protein / belonging to T4-LIKE GC: 331 [Synechococcus phage S-PM2]CAF34117.1 Hypothetical-Protein / belonging to T4-LIKE GC: 331 [Synechococcus phage S-PM2]CFW42161.1 hypothetical protein S-PM2d053 [Synechococcus phage S-PM2]